MEGCQYNELSILDRIFPIVSPDEAFRYVVEIGAADGIDNSN